MRAVAPFVVSLSNHISVIPRSVAGQPRFDGLTAGFDGLRANGTYFPDLLLASLEISSQSPRTKASFLARLQPLICRSKFKASMRVGHSWLNTSSTGCRVAV